MADFNPYFQRRGESITEWRKRLDAVDVKGQTEEERRQLETARRGIPLERSTPRS